MRLSVITICYNNCKGLERTARSIACQTNQGFEWIVIDGGSIDGTVELIKSLERQPDAWCSEPDKGIYNAMNKGIVRSHGEYLLFLNSGDTLADTNIVRDFLSMSSSEDIISGDILVDGSVEKARYTADECDIDYEYMALYTILHPSTFIRHSLFEHYGLYDERYRIVSDWKFFLEVLIQHTCTYRRWKRFVADFNTDGVSETEETRAKLLEERNDILRHFLPRVKRCYDKKNGMIQQMRNARLDKRIGRFFTRLFRLPNIAFCRLYLRHVTSAGKAQPPKGHRELVIVSMTSWKKRIGNVPAVVRSILTNTMQPDKIVLNLSLEEFPGRENDLPEEVVDMIKDGTIEIGWQSGNTYAFKKFLPTMQKYPFDCIIAIDDDFLYPKDMIETFMVMHSRHPDHPLSGNRDVLFGGKTHCGCASLVRADYFGNTIETLLDEEIINHHCDDVFYTFCACLHQCRYRYVGKEFFTNMEPYRQNNALSAQDETENILRMYDLMVRKIRCHYGIDMRRLKSPYFILKKKRR